MSAEPITYLPFDRDAARPIDLQRRQRRPRKLSKLPPEQQTRSWPDEDPSAAPFHYIGQFLTLAEFRDYILQYYMGSQPASYVVLHHTADPDASWAPYYSNSNKWWDRNESGMTVEQKVAKRKPQLDGIMRYYRDSLGWRVGPHLFIDELGVWLFTPCYYVGIHANEGNSYTKGSVTRYSIGIEVIGFFDPTTWPPAVYRSVGWVLACLKAAIGYDTIYTSAPEDRPDLHDPQMSGHCDYSTKTCPGLKITPAFYTQCAIDGWYAYTNGTPPDHDPLKACKLPGINGVEFFCGTGMHSYYYRPNYDGPWELGPATSDEVEGIDDLGDACTYMTFERVGALKYKYGEGVRPMLTNEAVSLGLIVPS